LVQVSRIVPSPKSWKHDGSVVVVLDVLVLLEVLDEVDVELLVDEVVLVVLVVVVVVGHTAITMPPPSVVTEGLTQLFSTNACGEPPSGHIPAFVVAAVNFAVTLAMQLPSRGVPFAAAFA
jgi:hypothetical protein